MIIRLASGYGYGESLGSSKLTTGFLNAKGSLPSSDAQRGVPLLEPGSQWEPCHSGAPPWIM